MYDLQTDVTPMWTGDITEQYQQPEEREGLNLAICEHGWLRTLCGTCTPIKSPVKNLVKSSKRYVSKVQ